MKLTTDLPYSDYEKAARGWCSTRTLSSLYRMDESILKNLDSPFLFGDKATSAEYSAGLDYAIKQGWLAMHESGTYIRLEQASSDLFA